MPKILLILDYRISAVIEVINPDSGLQRRLSSSGDLSELVSCRILCILYTHHFPAIKISTQSLRSLLLF